MPLFLEVVHQFTGDFQDQAPFSGSCMQLIFHTFVSWISNLMSQRYVEVKWIVINMAELLKIIQFGHRYIL